MMRGLQVRAIFTSLVAILAFGDVVAHHTSMAIAQSSLDLNLKPVFDQESHKATGINISMVLLAPKAQKGVVLVVLPLSIGPTPTARYDGDAIQARDEEGELGLTKHDSDEADQWRTWSPDRDPQGLITLSFFAPARKSDNTTLPGPRIDLRADRGGLFGKGQGFIPWPPNDSNWNITLAWDLKDAPDGTRVAWSGGDSLLNHAVGYPSEFIGDSFFAVGPLSRWPDWSQPKTGHQFSMYWINGAPWDMAFLPTLVAKCFYAVSSHFGDNTTDFAVFMRRVENGDGGTGGFNSFMLEYSPGTEDEMNTLDLLNLLTHEIIHEYPLLWPREDEIDVGAWYDEGIANYYVPVILYPNDIVTRTGLLSILNDNFQAYYTSPFINVTLDWAMEHFWDNVHITRIVYNRGFMYLTTLDTIIAHTSKGQHSLDDIVKILYKLRLAHENPGVSEFLELLSQLIGVNKAQGSYEAMRRGDLIVPQAHSTFPWQGIEVVRSDCYMFDLGFEDNSIREGKVQGLKPGSRAELAGVREGDEIVESSMVWGVADSYLSHMRMTVRRDDGEVVAVDWWPRGWEEVECWWWQDADGYPPVSEEL